MDIQRPAREDLEAFETTYNAACEYIARGQFDEAYLLLKRAKGALMKRLFSYNLSTY